MKLISHLMLCCALGIVPAVGQVPAPEPAVTRWNAGQYLAGARLGGSALEGRVVLAVYWGS